MTSRENATVTALYADNTQAVTRGRLLIEMDPSIAEVTEKAAEAALAPRCARGTGQFRQRRFPTAPQLAQAQVALAQAQSDYKRRSAAMGGAVSGEELSPCP